MKKLILFFLTVFFIFGYNYSNAQLDNIGKYAVIVSGDLNFLLDQKELNVEFEYGAVNEFKYEQEFIDACLKKRDEIKGKKWLEKYNKDKTKYQESFAKYLTKKISKTKIKARVNNTKAKYTLLVFVKTLQQGKEGLTVRKSTYIDVAFQFYKTKNNKKDSNLQPLVQDYESNETENKNDILAEYEANNIIGTAPAGGFSEMSYNPTIRIKEAFVDASRKIGEPILKIFKDNKKK